MVCRFLLHNLYEDTPENPAFQEKTVESFPETDQRFRAASTRLSNDLRCHSWLHFAGEIAPLPARRHFSAEFCLRSGVSPGAYQPELAMSEAEYLLLNTNLSSREVALSPGFRDVFYFSRLFRRKCGIAP